MVASSFSATASHRTPDRLDCRRKAPGRFPPRPWACSNVRPGADPTAHHRSLKNSTWPSAALAKVGLTVEEAERPIRTTPETERLRHEELSVKLALRASEIRQKINELPVDDAEKRSALLAELSTVETEYRSSLTAEAAGRRRRTFRRGAVRRGTRTAATGEPRRASSSTCTR